MRMEELLKTAVQQLNSGLLTNEAQVKQAVVLPILRGLGWDDTNPAEFVPEFGLDEGRVDYALCQTVGNPLVFIEAKRLGSADTKGEEQLFGYASNKGVPLLILTDGNVWDFYLSMAAGVPAERNSITQNSDARKKFPSTLGSWKIIWKRTGSFPAKHDMRRNGCMTTTNRRRRHGTPFRKFGAGFWKLRMNYFAICSSRRSKVSVGLGRNSTTWKNF